MTGGLEEMDDWMRAEVSVVGSDEGFEPILEVGCLDKDPGSLEPEENRFLRLLISF